LLWVPLRSWGRSGFLSNERLQALVQRHRRLVGRVAECERLEAIFAAEVAPVDAILEPPERFGKRRQRNRQEVRHVSRAVPAKSFADVHLVAGGRFHSLAAGIATTLCLGTLIDQPVDFELEGAGLLIGPQLVKALCSHGGDLRTGCSNFFPSIARILRARRRICDLSARPRWHLLLRLITDRGPRTNRGPRTPDPGRRAGPRTMDRTSDAGPRTQDLGRRTADCYRLPNLPPRCQTTSAS